MSSAPARLVRGEIERERVRREGIGIADSDTGGAPDPAPGDSHTTQYWFFLSQSEKKPK
jgi:hypothetical protein